jgi:hypothetical protein
MADGLDPVVASSQSDGRWKIAWVPAGTGTPPNPLSVATLKAVTTQPATYSFTPDGFTPSTTQATITDGRLTLTQDLSRPGKTTDALAVKYVDSVDPKAAAVFLTQNTSGFFVVRKAKDNAVDWTIGDIVNVYSVICGVQRETAPTENGLDLIEQDMFITAPTRRKVALVA